MLPFVTFVVLAFSVASTNAAPAVYVQIPIVKEAQLRIL
jgi:hypothetical protein